MPLIPLTGVRGKVIIPDTGIGAVTAPISYGTAGVTVVGLIRRWSADLRRDVLANDTFADKSNFKQKIGGMYDLAGTCEGWMDKALAFNIANLIVADYIPDVLATIELAVIDGASSNLKYVFGAIISNLNMQVTKASELSPFTLSFESTTEVVATDAAP